MEPYGDKRSTSSAFPSKGSTALVVRSFNANSAAYGIAIPRAAGVAGGVAATGAGGTTTGASAGGGATNTAAGAWSACRDASYSQHLTASFDSFAEAPSFAGKPSVAGAPK